jgi:isochorismate pyruvate lyase
MPKLTSGARSFAPLARSRTEAGVSARKSTVAECASLDEVRSNIDRLDREIVKLLAQREKYVLQAARFKKTEADVHAPARVEEVVANVRRHAGEFGASPDVVERGYRVLVAGFTEAELAAHRS